MQEDSPATCMHTHPCTQMHTSLPPSLLNLSAGERSLLPKLSAILLDGSEYYRVLPRISTRPYTPPLPQSLLTLGEFLLNFLPVTFIWTLIKVAALLTDFPCTKSCTCGSPSELDDGLLEGRTISYSSPSPTVLAQSLARKRCFFTL